MAHVKFRYQKGLNVGNIDAEFDSFLAEVFLDRGDLRILQDTKNAKSVIVGRTGAGKTALLLQLENTKEHVLRIHPDALSLQYLSNSTILPTLVRVGVNLDLFYALLWRHIFVMELIRARFNLLEDEGKRSFTQRVADFFTGFNQSEKAALDHYREWNPSFWETTSVRVKEITKSLDERLKAGLGAKFAELQAGIGAEKSESTKVSMEVVERAQSIVKEVSLEHIRVGMGLVQKHVLNDPQKPYYIVIDDLDKKWVDVGFAYDLIEALLEAVADFAKLPNLKVIIALRENIVDILHHREGAQRPQREKQENLFLNLRWSADELVALMDKRLTRLLHGLYTHEISFEALLPPAAGRRTASGMDFVLRRTLNRPRDVIDFVNRCLEVAGEKGKNRVTWPVLTEAELRYSAIRLRSLVDEWMDRYPGLGAVLQAFDGQADGFRLNELDDERMMTILLEGEKSSDVTALPRTCFELERTGRPYADMWRVLLPVLVRISFLGVREAPMFPIRYSYESLELAFGVNVDTAVFFIHPAYHSALHAITRT